MRLSPCHYLYYLNTKALASILAEHGLKANTRKDDLVAAVSEAISADEIAMYVHHVMDPLDVRLVFPRWKPLFNLLRVEMNRIYQWKIWLEHEHLTDRLPWSETQGEVVSSEPSYDNFRPVVDFPSDYLDKVAAFPLWETYWDATCDEVLIDLVSALGWNATREVADAGPTCWGHAKSARFVADSQAVHAQLPMAGYGSPWKWMLEIYCEVRRRNLGVQGPPAATKKCAHCNQGFNQASIPPPLAQLAGYHLDFCRRCLTRVFYYLIYDEGVIGRSDATDSLSGNEMLARVVNLAEALETIPVSSFCYFPQTLP